MSRRHCCCVEDCFVIDDNFNRCAETPTSNIGNGWTVDKFGTWTIRQDGDEECVLHEQGTLNAKIINETTTAREWQVVTVYHDEENQDPDAVFRIFLNYVDAANHIYIDVSEFESTFYQAGGLDFGGPYNVGWGVGNVQACLNKSGLLSFGAETADDRVRTCASVNQGGRMAGVGNAAEVPIEIRRFELIEHYDTLDICPFCCCQSCDNNCLQDILHVQVESLDGTEESEAIPCSDGGAVKECCMDGESFNIGIWHGPSPPQPPPYEHNPTNCSTWIPLPFYFDVDPTPKPRWLPACRGDDDMWYWSFHCQTYNEGNLEGKFVLKMDERGEVGNFDGPFEFYPLSVQCNPFVVVFEVGICNGTAEDYCEADPEASPEEYGVLRFTITEAV